MTTSLNLGIKSPNNKQKAITAITDITNQYFSDFLKEFKISPYLGYKKKQVHNEPTGDYFFLIKHITKLVIINNHIHLRAKIIKLGINRKILSKTNWKR